MVGRAGWALGHVALAVTLLAMAGCSRSTTPRAISRMDSAMAAQPSGRVAARDDSSEAVAAGAAAGESAESALPFADPDERTLSQDHPYRDRHGLADCEIDCSVHEAGYKWAALHSLHDAHYCAGKTAAFVDGCRAYVGDHRG